MDIATICQAPEDGPVDTPAQAMLRGALIQALAGLDPISQLQVGKDLVQVMRDDLMAAAHRVRKAAARNARDGGMSPAEIAAASGQSPATVSRLLARVSGETRP